MDTRTNDDTARIAAPPPVYTKDKKYDFDWLRNHYYIFRTGDKSLF